MASKNSVKPYVKNGIYHIYNRGVEKRSIFVDAMDYSVFLDYLKTYLLPKDKNLSDKLTYPNLDPGERQKILKALRMNNFHGEISLVAYCLMPNHFHLLIKQNEANSIDRFMNSFLTRYVMYFNKKYKRVGPLFQDVYKAVLVESDEQLLHLTAYIHRNPVHYEGDPLYESLHKWPSSYADYIGIRQTEWLESKEILAYFSENNPSLSYRGFVETYELDLIKNLVLDEG